MYNPYEPFMNLANANLDLFKRFANSSDVTSLVQDTLTRAITIPRESMTKASQTGAFNDWTQGLVDNATRFTQEYVNGLTQAMAVTQSYLSRQVEQGTRQFAQITDAAEQAKDETTEAVVNSAKTASERSARSTK